MFITDHYLDMKNSVGWAFSPPFLKAPTGRNKAMVGWATLLPMLLFVHKMTLHSINLGLY